MSRLKCLQSIDAAGLDVLVECSGCGRRVQRNPLELYGRLRGKWLRTLAAQAKQLKCSGCGRKDPRIAPVPRIVWND